MYDVVRIVVVWTYIELALKILSKNQLKRRDSEGQPHDGKQIPNCQKLWWLLTKTHVVDSFWSFNLNVGV